jgi:hypothetical protein
LLLLIAFFIIQWLESVPAKILFSMKGVEKLISVVAYNSHAPGAFASQRRMEEPIPARRVNEIAACLIQRLPQSNMSSIWIVRLRFGTTLGVAHNFSAQMSARFSNSAALESPIGSRELSSLSIC